MTPEGLALAEAHDRAQQANTQQALLVVAALFTGTIDPADLDRTFRRYVELAELAINDRRARGSRLAQGFYRALRAIEARNPVPYPDIPFARPVPAAALQTSLAVTGPVAAKRQIARGVVDVADALSSVLPQTLGATSRHVENGARDTIRAAVAGDPSANGWARRSGGKPCAFCAMLIGRGPVYKREDTGNFRCHDHCRCSAVPVFDGDEGWTEQSREFNDLWYRSTSRAYGMRPKQQAFFKAYNGSTIAPQRPRVPKPRRAVDDLPKIQGGPGRTIDEARLSNPHYMRDMAYGVNCTHVAQTVELRARGYDVQATRLPDRFFTGIEGKGRNAREVLDAMWQEPGGGSAGARLKRIAKSYDRSMRETMDFWVEQWPEGARGQIVVSWKESEGGGGHIFNVEKRGGKAVYIEGQNSKNVAENADAARHFDRSEHHWLARTDDLELRPDANIGEFSVPRGTAQEPPSPAERWYRESKPLNRKLVLLSTEQKVLRAKVPANSEEARQRRDRLRELSKAIYEVDQQLDALLARIKRGG